MKQEILLSAILLITAFPLLCVNHMDILTTMTGEFNGSTMGYSMAALDFNGDGYQDLVVTSQYWNPTGVYSQGLKYGKLYFYFGGPDFDNIPEYVIEGSFNKHLIGFIYNAGDMNGDGIEDLAMCTYPRVIPPDSNEVFSIYVFYGREVPQAAPDYTLNIDCYPTSYFGIDPIGDVNHDGYADLSLVTDLGQRLFLNVTVILGNSFIQVPFVSNNSSWGLALSGIGDVNNDGIDDFHLYYPTSFYPNLDIKLIIYYGGSSFPDCDSVMICQDTNAAVKYQAYSLGDVNGDGYNDFLSLMTNSSGKVWFGSTNISAAWDVELTPGYFELNRPGPAVVHGDFNNDGFEDIVGSDSYEDAEDGVACLWLGRAQFNGTSDMDLTVPVFGHKFGYAKAAGDFNGDGFCDVAISAPWWSDSFIINGYVYIFGGNAELEDTTVSVEDPTLPAPADLWKIDIYPNPIKKNKINLKVDLSGTGFKQLSQAKLLISDVKGRRLYKTDLSEQDLQSGQWQTAVPKLPAGLYLLSISSENRKLTTRKLVIY